MAIRFVGFVVFASSVLYANAKIVEELKSNTGDVSLSINIPSLALSDILGRKTTTTETRQKIKANNDTAANSEDKDDSKAAEPKGKSLDLAKLLSSGTPVSIKSTETSTMGEKGNTEKSVKEIAIDTMGSEAKSNSKQSAEGGGGFDDKTVQKLVSALKNANANTNSNSNQNSTGLNVEEVTPSNPTSGLTEGKTSKAVESPKDGKELKTKDKASETSNAAAGESKPAPSEGAKASKQNNVGNQIALVPVSLPSSVLSQLQSALNGGNNNNNNNNNMSAAGSGGNSSAGSMLPPGLAALLGQASNANNNNQNNTAEKEMSNAHNDTNASVTHNAFNETSSMTNNTAAEGQEGSKIKNEEEHNHYNGENQPSKQVDLATTASQPAKKDTPVLVVIPQITNTARDLTESKSGFFSKKVTSTRVRSGLHKKSKLKYKKNE